MITKEEYLAALDVVRSYHDQVMKEVKTIVREVEEEEMNCPKRGDTIRITKVKGFANSKYVQKGFELVVADASVTVRGDRNEDGVRHIRMSLRAVNEKGRNIHVHVNSMNYDFEIINEGQG